MTCVTVNRIVCVPASVWRWIDSLCGGLREIEATTAKTEIRVSLTDRMVLIGFGLAAVYWLLDTFIALFLSSDLDLFEQLFGFEMGAMPGRLIVLCLFIIFGSHAQFAINARREASERSRRETALRERFQRLLSPDLAAMVVPGRLNVERGGESRNATELFVDIRDFTTLSETANAPYILHMLREYYELMVAIAFRYEGAVEKFIGDAMMVIRGHPLRYRQAGGSDRDGNDVRGGQGKFQRRAPASFPGQKQVQAS